MADSKPEIKVEDNKAYSDNIAPEYKNYSSVARKPFKADGPKRDDNEAQDSANESSTTPAPSAPKAPGK